MKAAIIKITDFAIDCDRSNILDQINDIVDDFDIFKWEEFQDNESLNLLVLQTLMNSIPKEALEKTEKNQNSELKEGSRLRYNVGATVVNIYESLNYLYAAFYVSLEDILQKDTIDEEDYKNAKINHFGSQICSANVASDLVIVRYDLMYEVQDLNIATNMNLTNLIQYTMIHDLVTIFQHRGLIVEPNGDTTEYYYIQNPLENVILTDSDYEKHYRFHDYEVFNHQLSVFVDIRCNSENSILNDTVSRITNSKVYGRALLSLSKRPEFTENPDFVDLTDERFESIAYLRSRSPDTTMAISKSDKTYVNLDKIFEVAKNRYSNMVVIPLDTLTIVLNNDK